ncbi:MAG: leucyl aminopeptidase [Nanohaloarchaea archaeon SW_7_46_7]|nr:MAG: leucyl aminopeptidase [Nanohaloarchaea archaeon SW_7_46_7]
MTLREGAETIVKQCLNVQRDEHVLVLNDSNDQELIDALMDVLEEEAGLALLKEYEEPENHGDEPPEEVAQAMKDADVVIAPTMKSLSHTDARREACASGSRVATLPTIDREIWNGALQADYEEVEKISEKVYSMLEDTEVVRIKTPSGTELELDIETDTFHTGTGLIHEEGAFGNLPAGEADGASVNANGTLVVDHFVVSGEGAKLEIQDNEVVAYQGEEGTDLEEGLDEIQCVKNVAEFGFGTNPEASLIGNILEDEKVLGTVHIALGDNSSYMNGSRAVNCEVHWDAVCEEPTVWFDDEKVLDSGEPVFLK